LIAASMSAPYHPAGQRLISSRRLSYCRPQLIVIENVRSANASRESVTRTVKVNVPAAVGVPVIRPGLSASSSPGGSSPETKRPRVVRHSAVGEEVPAAVVLPDRPGDSASL
jgi:hypothetical protein